MLRLLLTAATLALAAPAAALAAGPFVEPSVVAQSGGWPDVAVRPDGGAAVSWTNSAEARDAHGVWVATRPPGGALGAPEQLFDRLSVGSDVDTNERGDVVVSWAVADDPRPHLRVRRAGGPWGPVEAAPMPPLQPARHPFDRRLITVGPRVVLAPDGTATLSWLEEDRAADTIRAVAVVRRPDGAFGEPQPLGPADVAPRMAGDRAGGVVIAWRGSDPGPVQVAERAAASNTFGPPSTVAPSSLSRPHVAIGPRGDALVSWAGGAAGRPPSGPWTGSALDIRSTTAGAVNARGDGAIAWTGEPGGLALRPAGGAFGPLRPVPELRQFDGTPLTAAYDGRDNLVVLWQTQRPGAASNDRSLLRALMIAPGAAAPTFADVSRATGSGRALVSNHAFATDAHGNGLAVWLERPRIMSAVYDAAPPAVTGLRATPRRGLFRFRLSEPARVALTIMRGRRIVTRVERTLPAGANRIVVDRRRLRRAGRYEAIVDVADAARPLTPVAGLRFRVR